MENKSHALAAGGFVLALLALLIALAVWLTRDNRALRTFELSSPQAVTGLQPEASVRFKGVEVGKVTALGFDPLNIGHVRIRIAVDDTAPLTESSFATLGYQGVTELAFIALDDNGPATRKLTTSATAPTRIPLRPGLIATLSTQGMALLSQLDETSHSLNRLLSADNQKVLLATVASLGQAATRIQQLAGHANQTLTETSDRVGDSADEARASAKAFKTVTERMNEPGGTLDQLRQSAATLTAIGQTLNAATLPRLNQTLDATAQTARQVGQATEALRDNPQSFIFGNGPQAPGPGEPGFAIQAGKPQ
jgi:phospholipid/cholesterol/gamma-HCH transport system substrate-binding protein